MRYYEIIEFLQGRNCQIEEMDGGEEDNSIAYGFKILCDGKEFVIGLDCAEVDLVLKELLDE